jgi:hypothetical protein
MRHCTAIRAATQPPASEPMAHEKHRSRGEGHRADQLTQRVGALQVETRRHWIEHLPDCLYADDEQTSDDDAGDDGENAANE